jgi:hypothetical protein
MKQVRLVVNMSVNSDGTYTLYSVKVISESQTDQSRLEGFKTVDSTFNNVSSLFAAIQTMAVDIATSSLV